MAITIHNLTRQQLVDKFVALMSDVATLTADNKRLTGEKVGLLEALCKLHKFSCEVSPWVWTGSYVGIAMQRETKQRFESLKTVAEEAITNPSAAGAKVLEELERLRKQCQPVHFGDGESGQRATIADTTIATLRGLLGRCNGYMEHVEDCDMICSCGLLTLTDNIDAALPREQQGLDNPVVPNGTGPTEPRSDERDRAGEPRAVARDKGDVG